MTKTGAWRRGVVDAVLILASILVAFWIDAWWEDRQAMHLESDALSAVHVEVEENLRRLEQIKSINERYLDDVDRFLRAAPDELRSLPPDAVRSWIGSLYRPSTFEPDRAAASVLATLPVSSSRGSAEARRLVSRLQSQLERTERVAGGVVGVYTTVREQLARYASRSALQGRENLPSMVARIGPDVLAQLRRDDEFVSAVIEKAHVQSIYVQGLDQVVQTLDSLSVLLNER